MKLDHLGYVTRDMKATSEAFIKIGFSPMYEKVLLHEPKNMYINRVRLGELVIEIMSKADSSRPSFIDEALESTKNEWFLQHLCYEVDDIDKKFQELLDTGSFTISESIKGTYLRPGNKIGFLRHPVLGLIEFIERKFPEV